jgi:hypothetical protein
VGVSSNIEFSARDLRATHVRDNNLSRNRAPDFQFAGVSNEEFVLWVLHNRTIRSDHHVYSFSGIYPEAW